MSRGGALAGLVLLAACATPPPAATERPAPAPAQDLVLTLRTTPPGARCVGKAPGLTIILEQTPGMILMPADGRINPITCALAGHAPATIDVAGQVPPDRTEATLEAALAPL